MRHRARRRIQVARTSPTCNHTLRDRISSARTVEIIRCNAVTGVRHSLFCRRSRAVAIPCVLARRCRTPDHGHVRRRVGGRRAMILRGTRLRTDVESLSPAIRAPLATLSVGRPTVGDPARQSAPAASARRRKLGSRRPGRRPKPGAIRSFGRASTSRVAPRSRRGTARSAQRGG